MEIPNDFTLLAEDIQHLRLTQLSLLTGIDPSNFSAWINQRRISERNLERIAQRLGMSKPDLLVGLELRRNNAAIARTVQAKANRLIEFLNSNQETA